MSKPFVLETDASQHHVAGVLMQYSEKNRMQVIACFSKRLRPVEARYSTTDRKAPAVVLTCREFNGYLWGTKFTIRTDHQPVVNKVNSWILEMMDCQFTIDYKQGKKIVVADQLSRPARMIQEEQWLRKSREDIRELQREERRWSEMEFLEGGLIPRSKYPRTTVDQFE